MDLDQKMKEEEWSYVTKNDHETKSLHVTQNYFWHIKIIQSMFIVIHFMVSHLIAKCISFYTAILNAFKL